MALSASQRAAAAAAVQEVRRAFAGARGVVLPAAERFWATDAEKAVATQLQAQNVRAENWATAELADVERGAADFTWWLGAGEVYARFASSTIQDSYNGSLFAVVSNTVSESARDVATVAETVTTPSLWPAWATVAVVAVGGVVVLWVALPYARALGVAK